MEISGIREENEDDVEVLQRFILGERWAAWADILDQRIAGRIASSERQKRDFPSNIL